MNKININIVNHENYEITNGETALDISKAIYGDEYKEYLICSINNEVLPLNTVLKDGDIVEFHDIKSVWGYRTYQKTASAIFCMALDRLFPEVEANLNHYLGAGLYIDFNNGFKLNNDEIEKIANEMKSIIDADVEIKLENLPRDEAIRVFEDRGKVDKLRLYKSADIESVDFVKIGNYIDAFYSPLTPSTGFMDKFRLKLYYPGLLLITPSHRNNYDISKYKEMRKLSKVFSDMTNWGKIMDLNHLGSMNEKIINGEYIDVIRISESLQERKIAQIADSIVNDKDVRMILISGPTSSGKTTFSKRLMIQLKLLGVHPKAISMDDYFVDRDKTPLDENGEYDFESPYAIDIELFNRDINELLNGCPINHRKFDFIEGKGEITGEIISVDMDSPIIVEGIHGLNPILTKDIPEKNKFKIYVSALTQLNLDAHNRISTTDTRFIRRAVRDYNFRGNDIEKTFKLWQNVKYSEDKYIFPFQENADMMFDSSMVYEMGILKKHILKLLDEIGKDSEYYSEACKLKY
ncbi:MAG: TGS domain-containing protein [Tissierellia bacterium]|nr:TGS domain-containing protein [Tissierellia bacterium]